MIARVDHPAKHDPIPAHLRIVAKDGVPEEERADDIARELRAASFDPELSRALVFCSTRRATEEESEAFELTAGAGDPWRGRVGHFHAGMGKEDRDEVFERYKDGRLAVLFATKAFGMGMDVPNIHHVFHHTPPSSLEDFLQEIGRAGRNATSRGRAGISEESPIRCVLYATPDDFKKKKDRLHKGHLSWVELPRIQGALHQYAVRVGALAPAEAEATDPSAQKLTPPKYFPLPNDLIEHADEFREAKNPEALQRMGLYWLEQLGRLELGDYLPAHLEFENQEVGSAAASTVEVQALCRLVSEARAKASSSDATLLLSTDHLLREVKVAGFPELFKVIAQAQKQGLVRLARHLKLRLTKKRADEIETWVKSGARRLPSFLEAAYALAHSVLRAIPEVRTLELDLEWLNGESRRLAEEHFAPAEDTDEALRRAEREQKDFLRPSRSKAVLRTVQECPGVLFKRELRDSGVTYLLRNDQRGHRKASPTREKQSAAVRQHRDLTGKLLRRIYAAETAGESINLIDLLIEEEVPAFDISFLERVLLFLRWMGYIHMSSVLPMAIECYLHSVRPVSGGDDESGDRRVVAMYEENRRLKVLRLAALQALAETPDPQRQNKFIVDYFQTEGADDVLELIEGALVEIDTKHPLIQEIRQAALRELEGKLSEEQRAVYRAPVDRSVVVMAGPGSGKTHTLLLRLARLIHEENVDPSSILVLAYNRAVVTEIKHRLSRLLGQLGYRSLVKSLRVFTFHGLIKYCLREDLDDLDLNSRTSGDPWVERFLQVANAEPGKIYRWLNPQAIRYIFIDEFQDITQPRYAMLRWLAPPHCSVTVIGDPNQSIYGYDRVKTGDRTRASEPYFERFQVDYQAEEYRLLKNFRSYEQVIRTAEDLIALNENRRLTTPLEAVRKVTNGWMEDTGYVQRHAGTDTKWFDVLQGILEERNERGAPYREVALLFRSNQEVYLAYRRIQDQLRDWLRRHDATVTVQGDGVSLSRVREIAYYVGRIRSDREDSLKQHGHDRLPSDYIDGLIEQANAEARPAAWSGRLGEIYRAVLREYEGEGETNPTFAGLLDFMDEILRKDSGQLYKLIQMSDEEQGRRRTVPDIILSNIHKVKGLEFDAVVMPPSFAPLPFDRSVTGRPSEVELADMLEEERRVYYVGITRARDRFVAFDWLREEGLREGRPFQPGQRLDRKLGIPFKGDPYDGSVVLFKCASRGFIRGEGGFKSEAEYMGYLHREVAVGDPLRLVCKRGRWYVQHGQHCIAALSHSGNGHVEGGLSSFSPRPEALEGLVVTEVVRHTLEEALRTDAERGTTFTERWSPYFTQQAGFTYVVNFAGYATPA